MKPEKRIQHLITAISDPSRVQKAQKRQTVSLNNQAEPVTFILHEGTIAVFRDKDRLLMSYTQGPLILGLNDLIDVNSELLVQAYSDIHYEVLPLKTVLETVRREHLWEDVAYYFMFSVKRLIETHRVSVGLSTYELIRYNLDALMGEKDDLRLMVTACDYILDKTHLSRSRVMKILRDLRTGGYIELKRGILLSVNKLPESY